MSKFPEDQLPIRADEGCDHGHGAHVFADSFTPGDTCLCGAFYLLYNEASGVWSLEPAPEPES